LSYRLQSPRRQFGRHQSQRRRFAAVGAEPVTANLREVGLGGANLSQANLNGSQLIGANLSATTLYQAHLHGAVLNQANLTGAVLPQTPTPEA